METVATKVSDLFANLPAIGAPYENGIYAGLSIDNERPVKLVLLSEEIEANWKNALAFAEKQGGVLPSRIDQLVLFKNLKSQFQSAYYWSGEQHASDSVYAWLQLFINGGQYFDRKVCSCRARAVRRLVIE